MKAAFSVAAGMLAAGASPAAAAEALPGAAMGPLWAVPFLAVLTSIALGPLAFRHVWHVHYGKIVAAWAGVTAAALAATFGWSAAAAALSHALLADYLSFIVLLLALYTVAGGILVTGNVHGTPASNTAMLALGAAMASLVGTTGAAMILIRPLLRANDERRHNAHVVIFFIFLVANIGGALTPLGDPPLFVGFLRGVDFFWTMRHLFTETVLVVAALLVVFFALDSWMARREAPYLPQRDPTPPRSFRVQGLVNIVLVVGIVATIAASGAFPSGVSFDVLGTHVPLEAILRDGTLLALTLMSLWLTPNEHRSANGFTWEPIREVAKLFAAIFVTIIPVLAMLRAREAGAFAPLISLLAGPDGNPSPRAFFWITGGLSAVLDNAPTYLVFFEAAGGDAGRLMGEMSATLAALSAGAVYLGAMTYVGNAPNFMVYAIAVERGIRMPGFFGYLLWSGPILLPILALMSWFSFPAAAPG